IKHSDRYVLTDPWYNKPAFGSWLPSLAPYIHPSYLAALGDKLTILVSHGHDDHFDDKLFEIFDKKTKFITANFKSPSVVNRLNKIGFENIVTVGEEEQTIDGLDYSSYIVPDLSHDDATYLIRSERGAVIHANDNWHEFTEPHLNMMRTRLSSYSKSSILLFSQTNSASGFPLNYRNFTADEKQKILKEKVAKMVAGGLQNAVSLGIDRMFSYAGFATAYVKDKSYENEGLFPTSEYLTQLLHEQEISYPVVIPSLYPGDSVNLPSGEIEKAFVTGYQDSDIKEVTDKFYDVYKVKDNCISYRNLELGTENFESWLNYFLTEFDSFVRSRVQGPDSHYTKLIGKKLSLQCELESGDSICKTIQFGDGLVAWDPRANKVCYVGAATLYSILKGEALFEDLYTGYNAEWERFPENEYNRDIVMLIVMFSYVYRNRLSSEAKARFFSASE
ncbi:MBL fold metallo-hydrolase, partial [Terasakiella pusilla]|uniref:MBL fold metallo-hydrolase n=1 Tax=Terasakiella pusilla TaxID=64973 RepID=UPI00056F7917